MRPAAGDGDAYLVVAEIRGRVVEVRKQLIPKMHVTVVESDDGSRIEFDTHEDLITYSVGERLLVVVSREVPDYRDGEDYVVRATVVNEREEEGRKQYLLSAGGLLFILEPSKPLDLRPTEKVYIKVSRAY